MNQTKAGGFRKALVFTLALLLTFAVSTANFSFAAQNVAQIGNTTYDSLQTAIGSVSDTSSEATKIILLADTNADIIINKGQVIDLDLNGHTLDGGTTKNKAAIENYGTLTISDSSDAQTGTVMRDDENIGGYYVIKNYGTMYITGGTVKDNSTSASLIINGYDNNSGSQTLGTMYISGGTMIHDNAIVVKNDYGNLTITGGTITTGHSHAVETWNILTTITGGTITGNVSTWAWGDEDAGSSGKTVISGEAVIKGDIESVNYGSSTVNFPAVEITGGTISGTLKTQTYGKDGYTDTENGTLANLTASGGTYSSPVDKQYLDSNIVNISSDGVTFTLEGETSAEESAMAAVDYNGALVYFSTVNAAETFASNTGSGPIGILKATVTYVLNNGSADKTELVSVGDPLSGIAAPEYAGYTFAGWYTDKELTQKYDVSAPLTQDITLYAGYTKNGSSSAAVLAPSASSVKTGDSADAMPFLALASAALLEVFVLAARRRRAN